MKLLLLDTHIFLWLMGGDLSLSDEVKNKITQAAKTNTLAISAISLWEIAMLANRQRITLHQPVRDWIHDALKTPGLTLLDLSPDILCESTALPGELHKDPANRMIIATARIHHALLLTRDDNILRYANQGYLAAVRS
ncbi:MAG: type II toxin-antitoxin system VapC family toxin [Gammaproteobacteria bacterium]|nr:type II toxin-antitoxin system VapC family toxin [Gammaproteobacteria bacterium]